MAENYGFNIDLGLNSEGLQEGLKKINQELDEQSSKLYSIESQIRKEPKNIDAWKSKQKELNKQVSLLENKLKLQVAQLKQANKEYDGSSKAKRNIEALRREIDKTNKSIKSLATESKKAEQQISKMKIENFEKLSKLGSTLTRDFTAPLIAGLTSVIALTNTTANRLDDLADSASQLGADAGQYEALGYAIKILGGNTDSFYRALTEVNDMLGDIASGDSLKAAQNLSKIGLTIEDIDGLSSDQAFMKIRDALANMGDEAQRVAAANDIFGKRIAASLLPVLKAERSEVDKIVDEAYKLGVATENQRDIAGQYTDSIDRLKLSFKGLSNMIMERVAPTIINLTDSFVNNVIPKVNEVIKKIDELEPKTKKIIAVVSGITAALGPVLLVVGKIGTTLTPMIANIGKLVASLGPIPLIIAGIVAAIGIAYTQSEEVRTSINGILEQIGKVLSIIGELVTKILKQLKPVIDKLIALITKLMEKLLPAIYNLLESLMPVIETLADLLIRVFDILTPIIEQLIDDLSPILTNIAEILTRVISFIAPLLSDYLIRLADRLKFTFEMLSVIYDVLSPIIDLVGYLVNNQLEEAKEVLTFIFELFNNIKDVCDNLVEPIRKVARELDKVKDKFKDGLGFLISPGAWLGKKIAGSITGNNSSTTTNNSSSISNSYTSNIYTSSNTFDAVTMDNILGGKFGF